MTNSYWSTVVKSELTKSHNRHNNSVVDSGQTRIYRGYRRDIGNYLFLDFKGYIRIENNDWGRKYIIIK